LLIFALAVVGVLPAAAQQVAPPPHDLSLARRIVGMSEESQVAYARWYLAQGMPTDGGDAFAVLVLNRSSLVLPILEAKIEELLNSPSTPDSSAERVVDPKLVVSFAGSMIAYAGDQQSLKEISKLMKIDEQRFGRLVESTLANAQGYRNPLTVAYSGFEIGDAALDKKIAAWIEARFSDKYEGVVARAKHWWADALVDRYGGPPSPEQWANDPIASRLKPSLATALHDDVYRLALEALTNRNLNKK
jgi:hypothetical protein